MVSAVGLTATIFPAVNAAKEGKLSGASGSSEGGIQVHAKTNL